MKKHNQGQGNKRQWNWKRIFLLGIILPFIPLPSSAAYLQPVVYYASDEFGNPLTNAITISPWPATNALAAFNTNIIGGVSYTFTPSLITNGAVVTAYWSNNIAPGNYRLQLQGYTLGVPFGVYSNSAPINISQVANLPVTTFMNFTLAQFGDAGKMAYENTNAWARHTYFDISNSLAFAPATNNPATNTIVFVSGVTGITNGSGAVTNLSVTFTTNTINFQQR
jgi:hypothetical protein